MMLLLLFAAAPPLGPLPAGAIARLGSMSFNHSQGVTSGAFSRDGTRLVTCAGYGTMHVWDVRTGRLLRRLAREEKGPWEGIVRMHPREDLALWFSDGEAELRDLASDKPRWSFATSKDDLRAAWGHGGRWIAATDEMGDLLLRDGRTGKKVRSIDEARGWGSLAASPVRDELAIFADDGSLTLCDPVAGKRLWRTLGHREIERLPGWSPPAVAFDALGEWLLTGSYDGTVRLWRARDGKAGSVLARGDDKCHCVAFAPDGRAAASFVSGLVRIIDPRTGKETCRWQESRGAEGIKFSPDGRTIASFGHARVRLRDSRTGERLLPHGGHDSEIVGLAFLPGGRIVTGGDGGDVRSWDIRTGMPTALPRPAGLDWRWGNALSPDGRSLTVLTRGGGAVLDTATGRLRKLDDKKAWTTTYVFSNDSKRLAAVSELHIDDSPTKIRVRAWDAATGKSLLDQGSNSGALCFSPDGARLLALEGGGQSRIIDIASGKERLAFRFEHNGSLCTGGVAWSPDGRLVAGAGDGLIVLWDVRAGKTVRAWKHGGWTPGVLAFSPDGRLLATTGDSTRVWDTATGKLARSFPASGGAVRRLAFSPDGGTLASAGTDATVLLWDLSGRMRQPLRLSESRLAQCWKRMEAGDEDTVWELACCPDAPAFIRRHLKPQQAMPEARWKRLLADLDSDRFDARQEAVAALLAHGPAATGAVKQALADDPSLEVRSRLNRVLKAWGDPADDMRLRRAVAALALSRSPEARALLKELAAGAPGAPVTEEAKPAPARLL